MRRLLILGSSLLLAASALAATRSCPSGTLLSGVTATGPSADVIVARGATALTFQAIRTAGTATVVPEISCDGTAWAAVTNGSMAVDGTTTSLATSVLSPTCQYRANVTACSTCTVSVVFACSGP